MVVGFTDDSLKLLDMRMKTQDFTINLEGGHTNTVRQVKISDDGMICYSIGADNSLRVWDISTKKCIKVYKNDHKHDQTYFHKDSIWCMDISQNFKYVYTGGKDGSIFEIDILNEKSTLIKKGDG